MPGWRVPVRALHVRSWVIHGTDECAGPRYAHGGRVRARNVSGAGAAGRRGDARQVRARYAPARGPRETRAGEIGSHPGGREADAFVPLSARLQYNRRCVDIGALLG